MNFAEALLNNSASPQKVALFTQQGNATYGDLVAESKQIAGFLQDRGLQPGDRVLLVGESSLFWVKAYLGIALAGGVSVPVAVPGTPEFFSDVVKAIEPCFAFVQAKWLRRIDLTLLTQCRCLVSEARPPKLSTPADFVLTHEMGDFKYHKPDGHDSNLATIMFTSGSTATPRGVMVSHGNILSNTEDIITSLDIVDSDRMMAILPFYYCFGTSLLHTHLLAGASLVIDNRFLFPEKVLQNMQTSECTSLAGVPSTYQILLRRSNLKKMEFPHLKKLQQAGGKLAATFIDELEVALPNAMLFVMYGQTEATARLSCITPEKRRSHPGSIGQGLARVNLKVVDEFGRSVMPGVVGEIIADGPNITLGYWKNPEATERIYSGGLHTGDLATVDEAGFIVIVDRARDFIKCGGKRVSSRQIEETILGFAGLSEVAVVPIADDVLGEAVGLFAVHPDGESVESDLMKFCTNNLDHLLLPKKVIFLAELPRNNSGKPDKLALKKIVGAI